MKVLSKLILLSVVALFGLRAYSDSARVELLSFKDWKQQKIQAAKTQVFSNVSMNTEAQGLSIGKINKINQLRWNLEVAEDLSVSDYLLLYLSQQKNLNRYKEAATKLSIDEVASLLEAYAHAVEGNKPSGTDIQHLPKQATQNP